MFLCLDEHVQYGLEHACHAAELLVVSSVAADIMQTLGQPELKVWREDVQPYKQHLHRRWIAHCVGLTFELVVPLH